MTEKKEKYFFCRKISKWNQSKIIISVLLFSFCFFSSQAFSRKSSGADIETKIAVEKSMEERLRNVLVKIIGSEKLLVIISAQLYSESEKDKMDEDENIVLPGMPVKESIAQMGLAAMDTSTLVRNLRATIILDKGVSEEVVEVVKEVATGILGIDKKRGDQLLIKKMNFRQNPFFWGEVIQPPHLWWLLATISGVFFVIGLLLFLFGPFKKILKDLNQTLASAPDSGALPASVQQSIGASGAEVAAIKDEETPFSYLPAVNRKKLSYLFSKLDSEEIALILSYQPPMVGGELMTLLPQEKQLQVTSILSEIKELPPQKVNELDKRLREQISFTVGGEGYLEDMVAFLDEETREAVLSGLEKENPDLIKRIKETIIRPVDIIKLNKEKIYFFYQRIGVDNFSKFLSMINDEEKEKVYALLPEGLVLRIRQEIELAGTLDDNDKNNVMRISIPELRRLFEK